MPERERERASGPGGIEPDEAAAPACRSSPSGAVDGGDRPPEFAAVLASPQRAQRPPGWLSTTRAKFAGRGSSARADASSAAPAPPQHARRALARLVVTPTFIASASIVIVAAIAYGTTRTHLLYSGMGPACASASCTVTSPHGGGGTPNATSSKQGAAGQGSNSKTRGNPATGGSSATSQPSNSPSTQVLNNAPGPQPAPAATAGAGAPKSPVVIVYRTLRRVHGGFIAAITITNHANSPIKGWQFWMHYKSSRFVRIWGARWFPASVHVRDTGLAVPEPNQQTLRPGKSIRFTFQASGSSAAPDGCVFDGDHCSFGRS